MLTKVFKSNDFTNKPNFDMMILEKIKLSTIIKAYIKYSVFQLINDVINKTFALK